MDTKQKIINLITIVTVSFILYILTQGFSKDNYRQQNYINIVRAIAEGQNLSETMIKDIKQINLNYVQEDSPKCLIKAYRNLVIKQNLAVQNLFHLFQDSRNEYINIKKCSHYYSLLIQRAQNINQKDKNKVIQAIYKLQIQYIRQKYSKSDNNVQVCIYSNGFNNEGTIKQQIKSLANQSFNNSFIIIQDDASTDNTPIFIKYTIDQLNNNGIKNIIFSQNNNKSGLLSELKQSINKCKQDAIVLVLSDHDTILSSNVAEIINRIFTTNQINIGFFGAITTHHSNLQYAQTKQDLSKHYNPIFAFRRPSLDNIDNLIKMSSSFPSFDKNILAYHLAHKSSDSGQVLEFIDEAIVYREQKQIETVSEKLAEIQKLFIKS